MPRRVPRPKATPQRETIPAGFIVALSLSCAFLNSDNLVSARASRGGVDPRKDPQHFCDDFARLVKTEKLPTDAATYHGPIERVIRFSFRPARLPRQNSSTITVTPSPASAPTSA